MNENSKPTEAEKEFEKVTEDIMIESGDLFGDHGSKDARIRLLEAALLQALQDRDKWKETASKHQAKK